MGGKQVKVIKGMRLTLRSLGIGLVGAGVAAAGLAVPAGPAKAEEFTLRIGAGHPVIKLGYVGAAQNFFSPKFLGESQPRRSIRSSGSKPTGAPSPSCLK